MSSENDQPEESGVRVYVEPGVVIIQFANSAEFQQLSLNYNAAIEFGAAIIEAARLSKNQHEAPAQKN